MKVVILCGGKGTRMGKDLQGLPKAMITIGDKPIIWHIMKYYGHFGFNNFILCLGYKGEDIVKFFIKNSEFNIQFVDTGVDTDTGGRIKKVEKHIDSDVFFATYGDGLADINIKSLLRFHLKHKKIATLTAVRPHSTFGIVGINSDSGMVTHFDEKPVLDHWINGGFFVFNKEIFGYLEENDILERHSFTRLLKDKQVCAFKHKEFWKCMDTYKDNLELNELWKQKKAYWKVW